MSLLARCMCM